MVGSTVSPCAERALRSSEEAPLTNWLMLHGAGRTHRLRAEPREGAPKLGTGRLSNCLDLRFVCFFLIGGSYQSGFLKMK